jgi:hypothetical protein
VSRRPARVTKLMDIDIPIIFLYKLNLITALYRPFSQIKELTNMDANAADFQFMVCKNGGCAEKIKNEKYQYPSHIFS